MIPTCDRYWLKNAQIPVALLKVPNADIMTRQTREGLSLVDIEIQNGTIGAIEVAGSCDPGEVPTVDLKGGQVWCCFVDSHTHLDKGHIWKRAYNPDGTFNSALEVVRRDSVQNWTGEDVHRRMEFGLKCSYAHGTQAIRTHIDSYGKQAAISLGVFKALQAEWADRLTLQAVSLVPLDYFLTPAGEALADQIADVNGVLGGIPLMHPELDTWLDRTFTLAKERNLDLDFHTDETNDPQSITLRHVAAAALRHGYEGRVVCGHCCSLAVQNPEEAQKTMDLVHQAGIGVISLPMCNLYLQDRHTDRTPRWRGVTLVQELKQQGIPVAIASDNCRDPFHGYGDHDGLEVFAMSVKIVHLDTPFDTWSRGITSTPAALMGMPHLGWITVGAPADLILFKGRSFSELLSRPQHDRIVLRRGRTIDTTLPDYAELDDLLE